MGFNPRAHGGRDAISHCFSIVACGFQSTRPRGARLKFDFQAELQRDVSIHAPTGGATLFVKNARV